jgi:hypothetical protein
MHFISVRKNVARHFYRSIRASPVMFIQGKKFRTLSVDNFVRKWQGLH